LEAPTINTVLDAERELVNKGLEVKCFDIVKRYSPFVEKNLFLHKRDHSGQHPDNLGDFDVLTFLKDANVLLIVECKDISPPFCAKDSKRLRETIFGADETDLGHFEQILRRQDYLRHHIQVTMDILKWPIDDQNWPKVMTYYVSRRSYWWTKFPYKQVEAKFCRVDLLAAEIESILSLS
jgi:hypothetical protein